MALRHFYKQRTSQQRQPSMRTHGRVYYGRSRPGLRPRISANPNRNPNPDLTKTLGLNPNHNRHPTLKLTLTLISKPVAVLNLHA